MRVSRVSQVSRAVSSEVPHPNPPLKREGMLYKDKKTNLLKNLSNLDHKTFPLL